MRLRDTPTEQRSLFPNIAFYGHETYTCRSSPGLACQNSTGSLIRSASVLSQTIVNTRGKCLHLNLKRSQTSVPLILCEARRKRSALREDTFFIGGGGGSGGGGGPGYFGTFLRKKS